MGEKLRRGEWPADHGPDDFECFGPPATHDGDFDTAMICDMGCFRQDGTDSNKFYHGAVAQSKKNQTWYAYFEWGRVGHAGHDPQFYVADSKEDAHAAFAKQMHAKNDKRGEWVTKGALGRVLQAKSGKDCYLVRPQATRSTGLPDAKRITSNDGAKTQPAKTAKKKTARKSAFDNQTLSLMRDMNVATVSYTKSNVVGGSIPTQLAIDQARNILIEAEKRLIVVGDKVAAQVLDKELKFLTSMLYGRIPKVKPLHAPERDWILSQDNVLSWRQDLDAFESALYAADLGVEVQDDPFGGMRIEMEHLAASSTLGEFIHTWMPKATADRHGYLGRMKIANAWRVKLLDEAGSFEQSVDRIVACKGTINERPRRQPRSRSDLSASDKTRYRNANVGMLFHGTRSVNVSGILRSGLRLPKQLVGVVITGAMFGPGMYWADDWKKSAGYTSLSGSYYNRGSGAVRGRKAFMFVADVALGCPHVAPGCRGYTSPPKGHDSVFGKEGQSGVMNNEWIIYRTDQNALRYLVEFDC